MERIARFWDSRNDPPAAYFAWLRAQEEGWAKADEAIRPAKRPDVHVHIDVIAPRGEERQQAAVPTSALATERRTLAQRYEEWLSRVVKDERYVDAQSLAPVLVDEARSLEERAESAPSIAAARALFLRAAASWAHVLGLPLSEAWQP